MISPEIIHVNYIKKEAQTGSYCGMRYRLSKGKNEEGDCMDVTIWPEPFCFVKTPAEQKTTKQFPPDPGGLSGSCRVVKRTT